MPCNGAFKAKKKHVSLVKLFLQNWRGRAAFFFFFFLLLRFINRGKRSEMVSVVSRYERNEIWIEYIYFLFINSCTIVCLIPKLPSFLGKYKCYTCSIKLKTLILIFGVFQCSTLFMDHQLQLYIQQSQAVIFPGTQYKFKSLRHSRRHCCWRTLAGKRETKEHVWRWSTTFIREMARRSTGSVAKELNWKKKKCWRARLELTRALTRDTFFFFSLTRAYVYVYVHKPIFTLYCWQMGPHWAHPE